MTGDRSPVSVRRSSDRWEILRRHVQDGVPLTKLSLETGVGVRTLERWHAAVKHHGPAGPEAATRSDRGTRRAVPDHGWRPLSYGVVRDIVSRLDPSAVILAQDGPVAYRDKYELLWRHRAERPNAVWQADHTELDILIRAPNGHPGRPWLTVVLDDHSRAVCGYMTFLGAPSAMNTALALRQAIWPKPVAGWPMCGIPDRLYVDHGSDFTSHQLAQISHDLHFEIIFSAVARPRPQGRGKVERLFGSINTELLADLPGHLAPGQRRPEPVLTLRELDDAIGRFITENYLPRQHPRSASHPPRHGWPTGGSPGSPPVSTNSTGCC